MPSGPCARRVVIATIVTLAGKRYAGSNRCNTPQPVCPRGNMPTGVGYELCKSVCNQAGHAEAMALVSACSADLRGATCYVEGHTFACANCLKLLRAADITKVVFGPPPNALGQPGVRSKFESWGST